MVRTSDLKSLKSYSVESKIIDDPMPWQSEAITYYVLSQGGIEW